MKKKIALLLTIFTAILCLYGCNKEEPKYTITFEVNGGTEVESVTTSFLSYKPIPAKKDYYFENWYYNADFTGNPVVFPVKPTKNMTLYAKFREGIFDYTLNNDGTVTITNLLNCHLNKDVVIPNNITINGTNYPVKNVNITSINHSWLKSLSFENVQIDKLLISGEGIETIDLSKLSNIEKLQITGCVNLTSLTLPSVKVIPPSFITICNKIEKITIPSSVTTIKANSFANNGRLKTITFENGSLLKTIGDSAFSNTSIESINLSSTVTRLYQNSFKNCSSLKAVTLNSTEVLALDNVFVNYNKDLVIYVPDPLLEEYKTQNTKLNFNKITA